ncbi:MAG: hypothetical protein COW13_05325, partial [Candidatus Omnitrophica bacterium CG12_big_fil_rev_8_21_14_0_65_50_5]
HKEKVPLSADSADALIKGDFERLAKNLRRHAKIRDLLIERWLDLTVRAHEGETGLPDYAYEFARKTFTNVKDPFYKISKVIRTVYKRKGREGLLKSRLYSMDPIGKLMEAAEKEGITIFPLGAGGPGANLIAIDPRGNGHLEDFLKRQGLEVFDEERAREIIHGTGTLKGYLLFKVGKESMRFEGVEELGLQTPKLPEVRTIIAQDVKMVSAAMLTDADVVSPSARQLQMLARQTQGAAATTIRALSQAGIFEWIGDQEEDITFGKIKEYLGKSSYKNEHNEQYLLGALRVMSSLGWLEREDPDASDVNKMIFKLTDKGREYEKYSYVYVMASEFTESAIQWMERLFIDKKLDDNYIPDLKRFAKYSNRKWANGESIPQEIENQVNGYLAGPVLLAYSKLGFFGDTKKPNQKFLLEDLALNGKNIEQVLAGFEILKDAGYAKINGQEITLTEEGVFAVRRNLSFGVPVSYYPSYALAERLMFGEPLTDAERYDEERKRELLVNRILNTDGSGAAHEGYFRQVEPIMMRLVNKEFTDGKIPSIDEVKAGGKPYVFRVADIGAGNGAWLKLTYDLIKTKTEYGKLMQDHPDLYQLEMIGVDYYQEARENIGLTLKTADIPHRVFHGDIGKPLDLQKTFAANDISDGRVNLIIRSMLDHNRFWYGVDNDDQAKVRKPLSTGIFGWHGTRIPNNYVEQNLFEHFGNWKELTNQMLVIELHTIDDRFASQNLLATLDIAYQLSHLYSDQFIIEFNVFKAIIQEAGWKFSDADQLTFPASLGSDGATVSINYMTADNAMMTDTMLKGGIDFDPAAMTFETKGDAAMMAPSPELLKE